MADSTEKMVKDTLFCVLEASFALIDGLFVVGSLNIVKVKTTMAMSSLRMKLLISSRISTCMCVV